MKIIHTGDIHIGSAFQSLSGEKARLRQAEIIDGFRRLCTYARENRVGSVLIAGDLFDGNAVPRSMKNEVFSIIAASAPTLFFYVSGNHDDEFYAADGLPENLRLFSDNHGFTSYDLGENITVTGMDTRNFSPENFSAFRLESGRYNILLLHGELSQNPGRESIPLSLFDRAPVDYLALGHIHKPDLQTVRFGLRGRYRYCGCLEGRGYDETGARGFFLLDIINGKLADEKFYSIATRETCEVCVDITPCKNYTDVENAVFAAANAIPEKNLFKAVLCGRYALGLRKDIRLLENKLCEKFFHARVEDESRLALDPADYQNDRSECGEFVKEVGRYALTDTQREEILEIGLKALHGEEIDL